MIPSRYSLGTAPLILATLFGGGCLAGNTNPEETSEPVAVNHAPLISDFATIFQNGTLATFADITNTGAGALDLSSTVGLTACDVKALYAVTLTAGVYSLWFSNDSGQSWAKQTTAGLGPEIACDHSVLATLDGRKRLFAAPLSIDGSIGTFALQTNTTTVDRIQGGDGSIYGVKLGSGGNQLFIASGRSINAPLDWGSAVATIGATLVTGTGATNTGSDGAMVFPFTDWSRRAFALEANGTFSTNNTLLAGNNSWTSFNAGGERYSVLTAAAPNVLFGLETKGGVQHLTRISITETNCADGIDNDQNGLTDGEDSEGGDASCKQTLANAYCASHGPGTYCADRFQPATFLSQANQNASIVACQANSPAFIFPGVCKRNANVNITNADSLVQKSTHTNPEPAGTGHWCNVHWPDGTWDFGWTGATPCQTLKALKPNGTIVRAGLYSLSGVNQVHVGCNNGEPGPAVASGTAPLQALYDAVGHTANACVFTVAPTALPVFSRMFIDGDQLPPPRRANPFIHSYFHVHEVNRPYIPDFSAQVSLAQFNNPGNGSTATSMGIDINGRDVGGQREAAYDLQLDEGRPLYAVGDGIVIPNGSRARDVTGVGGGGGSPNQGEIFVKYTVGPAGDYQEGFVVYYAHVRARNVVDGQTVKAGQILGYTGATGATSGIAHLHVTVARITNTNARVAGNPAFGYRLPFQANPPNIGFDPYGANIIMNAMDPLGWKAPGGIDPWGYAYWNVVVPSMAAPSSGFTGLGGWSIALFKNGEAFHYP
jgi:hypothetical protein